MKKLLFLSLIVLFGCDNPALLKPEEYTIIDTTYTSKNGFGYILGYDIIFLNKYDSLYYVGELNSEGKLIRINNKPLILKHESK
jgi:hypothetical protein